MKMDRYRMRETQDGSIVELKHDDKLFSYITDFPIYSFEESPLMDLSYAIFYLIEEKPEIHIRGLGEKLESYVEHEYIKKSISNENSFILGFGLKVPIDVHFPFSSSKDDNGFKRIVDHPYRPHLETKIKKRKYRRLKLDGERIKIVEIVNPKNEIIRIEEETLLFSNGRTDLPPSKRMYTSVEIQNDSALDFLREVKDEEGIEFKGIYIDFSKRKGIVTGIGELRKESNEILIKTHPSILFSFMDHDTEVYRRDRF
ncbi:MAG: hypothetical protein J7K87_03610 [Candidatus Aenigmarchaeota archaeon]|nr:hypothetical protein [Candidatus Aenigmarchaeota archaeon]